MSEDHEDIDDIEDQEEEDQEKENEIKKENTSSKTSSSTEKTSISTEKTSISREKTSSSSSQKSMSSIGMGPSLSSNAQNETFVCSRLTPEEGAPPGETVYDSIAFIIYCSVHKKFALSRAERAVWMPFVVIPPSKTFAMSAADGICIVLSKGHKELDAILQAKPPVKDNICAQITRIQLPSDKFITQIIQIVRLDASNDDFKCCQNTKRLQWLPQNDVINGNIENIWGPEVTQFAKMIEQNIELQIHEFSLEKVLEYIDDESNESSQQTFLKSLQIDRKDLEKLYVDFIEHCFPSFFMSSHSFNDYMTDYGYQRNDCRLIQMFNAFNSKADKFIDFQDFLLGLTAMEANTVHQQFRFEFIFRYYDVDRDQRLTEEEVKKMLKDMSDKEDDKVLEERAKGLVDTIASDKTKITSQEFSKAIASDVLKGTDTLCRFSKPFLVEVSNSMAEKLRQRKTAKDACAFLKTNSKIKGICSGCRAKKYVFGLHSVKFDTTGRCVEPRRIFEPNTIRGDLMSPQRFSIEYKFSSQSIPQIFLDLIRDLNRKKGKAFLIEDKELFVKYLMNLCTDSKSLFREEERVIKLNSPVFIIGDIRAKLNDLLSMEAVLWHSFPIVSANFLFLGNYVEFGEKGIECIIYLLSLKLIAPDKIFLLKGCHEDKQFQKEHNFQKECLKKYGETTGSKVWELLNSVFDEMPIAVIVDETLYCANGGIPREECKIDEINTFASDLKSAEKYSNIANEILNNEPITSGIEVKDFSKGFAPNKSRKNSFWFNEKGVNTFLETNEFTHIIRSNNLYNSNGYDFHFGDKCLTVFSNSDFKNDNKLATVFVDNETIRIVIIQTQNTNTNNDNRSNSTISI